MLLLLLAALHSDPALAAQETYAEGIGSLHRLTLTRGVEFSRNYFVRGEAGGQRAFWGKAVSGTEQQVGINEEEMQLEIDRARKQRSSLRLCNFHIHRKEAVLRLQKERGELPKFGNRSFPPSAADVQVSIVGEDTWREWGIEGESAMGVIDSLGVWSFRELGGADSPLRLSLYRKHGFSLDEVEATRKTGVDAAEAGRYEFMKIANAMVRSADDIKKLSAYRKLVLQYAVLEDVEISFLPLNEAVKAEPCRGF